MVVDAVAKELFGAAFDRGGKLAAKGKPIDSVLKALLRERFFHQRPPKTAGREQFGREFVARFLHLCGRNDKHDVIATATALTARSIGDAIRKFVLPLAKVARTKWLPRIHRLRWRHEKRDPHAHDRDGTFGAERQAAHFRRLGPPLASKGSGRLRFARV